MEERKKETQKVEQKYTYEQLNKIASDLFQENRELKKQLNSMSGMLSELQTQNLFAYIGMLNKILDNAIHFKPEFVDEVAIDLMDMKRKIGAMFIDGGDVENTEGEVNDGKDAESPAA